MTKTATIGTCGLALLAFLIISAAVVSIPKTEAPVAPGIEEIKWGAHAFEKHGEQADRVIDEMRVCTPEVWFCDGPTTEDSYYIYICRLNGHLCGGAIVGRLAHGFTAYPAQCAWWDKKTVGCTKTTLGN